jgi:hypothetical protein
MMIPASQETELIWPGGRERDQEIKRGIFSVGMEN